MISFRLSEEEFCSLKEVAIGQGFGSLSDLLRTALQELILSRSGRGSAAANSVVQSLIARIDSLERDLKELGQWSNSTQR